MVARALKKSDLDVSTAAGGEEALEYLTSNKTDLIITDLKMPDFGGFELLEKMRQIAPDATIVVMTGFGDQFTVRESMMAGADDYIHKPFKAEELIFMIERLSWRFYSAPEQI